MFNPLQMIDYNTVPEVWLPVTDYTVPGVQPYYYVSNFGRVWSTTINAVRSLNYAKEYPSITLKLRNGVKKTVRIHRLVMLVFKYRSDHMDLQVNHINGIKTDNRLINLEWCTRSENVFHAYRTGLQRAGENHGNATHSDEEIHTMCKYLEQGLSNREVLIKMGWDLSSANYSYVIKIRRGERRVQISSQYNIPIQSPA